MAGLKIIANSLPADGWSVYRDLDLDENPAQVKGGAGIVAGFDAVNLSASVLYLKFYDAVPTGMTLGVTEPVMTKVIPTLGDTNGVSRSESYLPQGLTGFTTGITIAATTGLGDDDTTGPGADELVVHVLYK